MALNEDEIAEFEEQIKLQKGEIKTKESKSKTRTDEDGTVMEWDENKKIDDDFIAQYQMNYGISNNDAQKNENKESSAWQAQHESINKLKLEKGENHPEVLEAVKKYNDALQAYYSSDEYREWYASYQKHLLQQENDVRQKKNRKRLHHGQDDDDLEDILEQTELQQKEGIPLNDQDSSDLNAEKDDKKIKNNGPQWYDVDESKTTHVYVSGLPTERFKEDDFSELMSKYGLIAYDPLTNKPRVKLYKNQDGSYKGDGRCCFIKVESVDLAIQLLDGTLFDEKHTIHVERAKFQPKGEFDPNKRRRLTQKEKKKMKTHEESLFLQEDVTLIPIVKEKIRLQCAKCGTIKKIVVYDSNKAGIVTVTFTTAEEADAAIAFLDKALFDYTTSKMEHRAKQLVVERWDGKERFDNKESEEEERLRLEKWNKYLEGTDETEEEKEEDRVETAENSRQTVEREFYDEEVDEDIVDSDEERSVHSGSDTE